MSSLLEIHDELLKAASAQTVVAEEEAEAKVVVDERVEVLTKYAEAADTLLAKEYGDKYEQKDVEELASMMISHDMEQEDNIEKVAEYDDAGRIIARAFYDEITKLSAEGTEKTTEEEKKA